MPSNPEEMSMESIPESTSDVSRERELVDEIGKSISSLTPKEYEGLNKIFDLDSLQNAEKFVGDLDKKNKELVNHLESLLDEIDLMLPSAPKQKEKGKNNLAHLKMTLASLLTLLQVSSAVPASAQSEKPPVPIHQKAYSEDSEPPVNINFPLEKIKKQPQPTIISKFGSGDQEMRIVAEDFTDKSGKKQKLIAVWDKNGKPMFINPEINGVASQWKVGRESIPTILTWNTEGNKVFGISYKWDSKQKTYVPFKKNCLDERRDFVNKNEIPQKLESDNTDFMKAFHLLKSYLNSKSLHLDEKDISTLNLTTLPGAEHIYFFNLPEKLEKQYKLGTIKIDTKNRSSEPLKHNS